MCDVAVNRYAFFVFGIRCKASEMRDIVVSHISIF